MHESFAVAQLIGADVAVQFTNVSRFPRTLLNKSPVLHQALCDATDDEIFTLKAPQEFLQSWLLWRAHESVWDAAFLVDPPQIVKFLEVCTPQYFIYCTDGRFFCPVAYVVHCRPE